MTWPMTSVVTGWDPLRELQAFQGEMDRMMSGFSRPSARFPGLNVWNDQERTVVQAEVPGFDPNDIRLTVNGDLLTLEGERKPEPEGEGVEFHRRERETGAFSRSVRLPYEVEETQVKAACRNGVLNVTLPRKESTKPRSIAVVAE